MPGAEEMRWPWIHHHRPGLARVGQEWQRPAIRDPRAARVYRADVRVVRGRDRQPRGDGRAELAIVAPRSAGDVVVAALEAERRPA